MNVNICHTLRLRPLSLVNQKIRILIVGLFSILPYFLSAQGVFNKNDEEHDCSAFILEGDTIPIVYLDQVFVQGNKTFRNSIESRQWERLVKNVKKTYPYAKIAGLKFSEYSRKMESVSSEKVKKEMMKQAETEIEAQFGNELKDLTITQGKILLKLIDRETSNSSYDIVKEFRGRFRAFFYQSFARLFGYDLKVKYDPLGDDAEIERIVTMIESGKI